MNENQHDDWDRAFAELCAGFDRTVTAERRGAYRKSLGKMHIAGWQRLVEHCLGEKGPDRFPTAPQLWRIHRELRRQHRAAGPGEDGPNMSGYARFANRMLLKVAYSDKRRTFVPIAKYAPVVDWVEALKNPPKPIDDSLLRECLRVKNQIVFDAEESAARGDAWDDEDFRDMLQSAFEKLLIPHGQAA